MKALRIAALLLLAALGTRLRTPRLASTAAGLMAILLSIGSAAHAEEVFVGEAPASGHLLDRAYIRRAPREDAIQFTSDRHIRRTFDR